MEGEGGRVYLATYQNNIKLKYEHKSRLRYHLTYCSAWSQLKLRLWTKDEHKSHSQPPTPTHHLDFNVFPKCMYVNLNCFSWTKKKLGDFKIWPKTFNRSFPMKWAVMSALTKQATKTKRLRAILSIINYRYQQTKKTYHSRMPRLCVCLQLEDDWNLIYLPSFKLC